MWGLANSGIQKSQIVCSALRLTKESLSSRSNWSLWKKASTNEKASNNCWPQCRWDPIGSTRQLINLTLSWVLYKIRPAGSWNWQKFAAEQPLMKQPVLGTSFQAFIQHKSRFPKIISFSSPSDKADSERFIPLLLTPNSSTRHWSHDPVRPQPVIKLTVRGLSNCCLPPIAAQDTDHMTRSGLNQW